MARVRPNRVDSIAPAGSGAEPDPEGLRSLAAQLAAGAPEPLGVYALGPGAPEAPGGPTAAEAFAPYDHASLLLCVLDHHRRLPAGMVRLVLPSRAGLKTCNDLGPAFSIDADRLFAACGFDYDPNHTWDVAAMAIGPEYRTAAFSGLVTMALYQAVSVLGARLGFPWALTILHVPVLRMLQWKLHRPFHEFEGVEPRPYLDSPASLPAWMHLGDWHRAAELAAEVSALADLRLHLR